jgi:U3 small nucleolar RNA-associated protein 18
MAMRTTTTMKIRRHQIAVRALLVRTLRALSIPIVSLDSASTESILIPLLNQIDCFVDFISLRLNAAAPAWQDEDDGAVSVNVAQTSRLRKLRVAESETTLSGSELTTRLRARHESMNANADWAKLASASAATAFGDDDDAAAAAGDSAFLSSNASLLGVSSGRLPQGQLQITRMKDANHADVAQSCVTSVKFHNNGQLMLASGLDRTLRLFQVDGVRNPKVQSVFFDDMPIAAAQFTPDGQDIILAGRRKFFYSYDVVAGAITKVPFIKGREEKSWESMLVSPANDYIAFLGQDGHTVLVSRTTKQWLHNFKMNGSVRTAAFSGDGRQMYTAGDDGQVYLWDVRNLKCAHRFVDEGCIHSTALAVSPSNGHLAAGSNSGVVNLYGADQARTSAAPQPQRALMNLTTRVDMLEFNHDSQILAMASKRNKDALKLVHVPSKTVFANWPTSTTPLSYVQCLAFSPHSGYLAIGNDKGKVLLYRLNHFTSA